MYNPPLLSLSIGATCQLSCMEAVMYGVWLLKIRNVESISKLIFFAGKLMTSLTSVRCSQHLYEYWCQLARSGHRGQTRTHTQWRITLEVLTLKVLTRSQWWCECVWTNSKDWLADCLSHSLHHNALCPPLTRHNDHMTILHLNIEEHEAVCLAKCASRAFAQLRPGRWLWKGWKD